MFHGQPRKMLMQTSRNGYFFVLDRTNGKSLLTVPYGPVNWTLGVDKDGHPIPNPDKEPAPDGRLIAPDEGGLTNYRSPSFDPKTGLFIVDAHPSYSIYFSKPADGAYGWAGADYGLWGKGTIEAIEDPVRTVLAVQWHAETLVDAVPHRALFADLVAAARRARGLLRAA